MDVGRILVFLFICIFSVEGKVKRTVCAETELKAAARTGDLPTLRTLLKTKKIEDLFDECDSGWSAMEAAIDADQTEAVVELVEAGYDVRRSVRGTTPLHRAALTGSTASLVMLLRLGASPAALDALGNTPLYVALATGKLHAAEILKRRGDDLNKRDEQGQTYVHKFTQQKNLRALLMLEELGALFDLADSSEVTPLDIAVRDDSASFVNFLVARGARIEVEHAMASYSGNKTNAFRALLENDFKIDTPDKDGYNLMMAAVRNDDVKGIKQFKSLGSDVNQIMTIGKTPLQEALKKKSMKAASCLIDLGANPNIFSGGETPLMLASKNGDLEFVKIFISAGADVSYRGDVGETALHAAARNNRTEVVKELLTKGATPDSVSYISPVTPLMIAAENGNLEMVRNLISAGADVNYKDANVETALHVAARNNRTEVVKELLTKGATPDSVRNTVTPLMIAAENGNLEMFRNLISAGADVNRRLFYCCRIPHYSSALTSGLSAKSREIVEEILRITDEGKQLQHTERETFCNTFPDIFEKYFGRC